MMSRGRRSAAVGFAEVPDFHVAILRREAPELAAFPLLIGGDPAKRGKVVAASADLRPRGIVPGMGMIEALDRAPEAKCVRTDLRRAREISGLLRAAVRQEVDAVEIDGLAGFYFRAPSETEEAARLLERLEVQVAERTGLPLRLGVAPARFAARIAAEDAGERGATVIGADQFEVYLLRQAVDRLPGVGPKTAARLAELGAADIPGVRALGLERLEVLLGKQGRSLWLLACGQDPQPLRVRRHPATLSREETLAEPATVSVDVRSDVDLGANAVVGTSPVFESLIRIAGNLESALHRDGLGARRIALRLTYVGGRTVTRSCSLDSATSEASRLVEVAQALLARVTVDAGVVRRAGLVLKGLEISGAEDRQLDLF
jgi:DNA polymerase-4